MPDLTPAGELRAAAKAMRERAQAATPGPWKTNHVHVASFGSNAWDNVKYVASMHPGVALAVADWLDEVAADSHPELPAWVENAALTVARAYLGEPR